MTKSLNEKYFEWLVSQFNIGHGRLTDRTYDNVFMALYARDFAWFVPNDDNRVQDAKQLRREFLGRMRDTLPECCSVLEVMVALSRHMEFMGGGSAPDWAWRLFKNLGLHELSDPLSELEADILGEILERLIFRNYSRDGNGGLFPLAFPEQDQRKVELWYQMNAYMDEQFEM